MDSPGPLRVAVIVPAKKFLCLGSLLWTQRYGALQVASVVREAGYPVRLFNEELGIRVSPGELALCYDVLAFSCKSSAMTRAEELAQAAKEEAGKIGRRLVTVLGGEHVSMGGETRVADCFDVLLPGESEEAFVALLKVIENGRPNPVSFADLDRRHICPSFDNIPDLSLVVGLQGTVGGFTFKHLPLLWIIRNRSLPMLSFQGTRGCPYRCSFCPTPRYLQGGDYRRRSPASAVAYLREHLAATGIRRVIFEDPTAALPFDRYSHEFFEAVARSATPIKATVLMRADSCRDRRLLELMRAAGVTNVSVGVESLDERTRRDFNKKTSSDTIRGAIETFHEFGFSVTGLFIVGYDTDDRDVFRQIRAFINETGIEKWKVSPLTQMLEMENQLLPAHRFFLWDEFERFGKDVIDYGNGEFVLFYPRNMTPSALQRKIMEFNRASGSFGDLMRLFAKRKSGSALLQRFGNNLAQTLVQREILHSGYLEMMEQVEGDFYHDPGGTPRLREEVLLDRFRRRRKPIRRVFHPPSWLDASPGNGIQCAGKGP